MTYTDRSENNQFYYIRGEKEETGEHGRPIATVCLIKNGEKWARGISICSPFDNPDKEKGKAIAFHRAQAVIETGKPINFGSKLTQRKVDGMPAGLDWPTIFEYSSEFTSKLVPVLQSGDMHPYDGMLATPDAELTDFEETLLGIKAEEEAAAEAPSPF